MKAPQNNSVTVIVGKYFKNFRKIQKSMEVYDLRRKKMKTLNLLKKDYESVKIVRKMSNYPPKLEEKVANVKNIYILKSPIRCDR